MLFCFVLFCLQEFSNGEGRSKGFVRGDHLTVEVVRLLNSTGLCFFFFLLGVSDSLLSVFSSPACLGGAVFCFPSLCGRSSCFFCGRYKTWLWEALFGGVVAFSTGCSYALVLVARKGYWGYPRIFSTAQKCGYHIYVDCCGEKTVYL